MTLLTFRTMLDGEVSVRADLVASIRRPSGRVHDDGGLYLTNGRGYSFEGQGTCERIERELAKAEAPR